MIRYTHEKNPTLNERDLNSHIQRAELTLYNQGENHGCLNSYALIMHL